MGTIHSVAARSQRCQGRNQTISPVITVATHRPKIASTLVSAGAGNNGVVTVAIPAAMNSAAAERPTMWFDRRPFIRFEYRRASLGA
jgi:hypothetical protein